MLGSDEIDSLLEYILTGAYGFLLPRPFVLYVRSTLLKTRSRRCLSTRGKLLGTLCWGPRSLPRADERGGKDRQVVKFCPPALNRRVDNRWCGRFSRLILFRLMTLLFSLKWCSHFLIWGVWFFSRLPLEGTNHIQDFFDHNERPTTYLG
jgi:hypothetical protein